MLKNFYKTNDADPAKVWEEFPDAQVIKRSNKNDGYYVYGSLDIFFVSCSVFLDGDEQFEVEQATYPNMDAAHLAFPKAEIFDWDEKQNNGFWCWNSEEDFNTVMQS